MKITLLYQVSCYIRVKKQRNIKSWDQQNDLVIRGFCYIRPLYNEVPLYNQTWYIGALWEPSHYDALRGHMTRSKVIGGQIVIVILVNLFQILFEQVRFNYNQTWIIYRYTFIVPIDAFRGHMTRSKVIGGQIVSYLTSNCYSYGCPFSNCSCMNRFTPITTKLES